MSVANSESLRFFSIVGRLLLVFHFLASFWSFLLKFIRFYSSEVTECSDII